MRVLGLIIFAFVISASGGGFGIHGHGSGPGPGAYIPDQDLNWANKQKPYIVADPDPEPVPSEPPKQTEAPEKKYSLNPFRVRYEKVVCVFDYDSDFQKICGKVVTGGDDMLVISQEDKEDVIILNYPRREADGDFFSDYVYKTYKISSYKTAIGGVRNLHSYDYCEVHEPTAIELKKLKDTADCVYKAWVDTNAKNLAEWQAETKRVHDAWLKRKADAKTAKLKENSSKVLKFHTERAEAGNADSQYRLGIIYLHGEGVDSNIEESRKWLKKAADQGNKDAQKELSLIVSQ